MSTITGFIPVLPVPKGRPRMTRRGRTFTPKRTLDYEMRIEQGFLTLFPLHIPFTGPVELHVTFLFKRPGRLTCTHKRPCKCPKPAPREPHTGTPDLDNLIKAIADGLNGVAWVDDKQVWKLSAAKMYCSSDEQPGVHFEIIS